MNRLPRHSGQCFCGAVRFTVQGEPEAMGYCHCDDCRQWSASPVNAFTLWAPSALSIDRGEERIVSYRKTELSQRQWCRDCGGHLFTYHPELGLVDVYAALLPDLPFRPAVHVHYREHRLAIDDGLTKLRDVPSELGGSGIAI